MLRLESKCLELGVSLLISLLALAIFLLLQFEDLLEWGLGHGSRDIVLTVEVLDTFMLERNSKETRFLLEGRFQVFLAHTTSPKRRTFSPRTRKIPRGTSA
jgi:hypothetical protein